MLTLAFSLLALGVVPTALCCQAMAHGSEVEGCVKLVPCSGGDPLLAGLLTLTGALPETADFGDAELLVQPFVQDALLLASLHERQPIHPPPRV